MTKLIGTEPNQVPSNADLGTASFSDAKEFLSSKGSSLSSIDKAFGDTAYVMDVKIYDTSLDSDGGAWRKRTQHTSWYKEELNTDIRGSRREFPSVVVIVAQKSPKHKITIYDADDHDLPMWRVMESSAGTVKPGFFWDADKLSLDAMNGAIFMGNRYVAHTGYSGNGLYEYSFLGDVVRVSVVAYTANVQSGTFSPLIRGVYATSTDQELANFTRPFTLNNYSVNDIAVTVLPDAPIDSETGLPRPSIAVAHEAGTDVILNDKLSGHQPYGTWNNTYSSYKAGGVAWRGRSLWMYKVDDWYRIWKWTPKGSTTQADYKYDSNTASGIYPFMGNGETGYNKPVAMVVTKNEGVAFGFAGSQQSYGEGLSRVTDEPDEDYNMVNYTTSTYNTGWMIGDCRVATLCDTSSDTLVRKELILNGDFSNGTSNWTGSNATMSVSGGQMVGSGSASVAMNQNVYALLPDGNLGVDLEANRKYILKTDIISTNASGQVGYNLSGAYFHNHNSYKYYGGIPRSTYETVYTTQSPVQVGLHVGISVGCTSTFDNVSLTLAEENRTVYRKAFEQYGRIRRTHVAAGADLVSYSGFSATNQIIQGHYNTDLDFGTGDFCYSVWARHRHDTSGDTAAYYLWDRSDSDGTNRIGAYYIPYTQRIDLYSDGGTVSVNNVEPMIENWSHIMAVRKSGVLQLYVNGRLLGTNNNTGSMTGDGTGILRIGARFNGAEPWSKGELALFKVSATAPSAHQVRRIYEDEKYLFMDNAKCTLIGTDDEVDALGYDSYTETLHAGTGAGRSSFQGLCRVDSSTNPIQTAISASNNLVVED